MDTEITRSFELMRFSIWENVLNGARLSFVAMEWPEIWDVEEGAVMLETDDNSETLCFWVKTFLLLEFTF
jgi:hypothetical protein